jgi:hypothetical protein
MGVRIIEFFFWVGLESICMRNEDGGMGVRQLREFNVAMLVKWCWSMLVNKGGLRFHVLGGYKVEGGRVKEGVREGRVSGRRRYISNMKLILRLRIM